MTNNYQSRSFLYLIFLHCLTISASIVIRRDDADVHQACMETLQLQRIDLFEGDDVQLACTCQKQLQNQQQAKMRSVVTDSSDFLDISVWSLARQLQNPIEFNDFSLVANKVRV